MSRRYTEDDIIEDDEGDYLQDEEEFVDEIILGDEQGVRQDYDDIDADDDDEGDEGEGDGDDDAMQDEDRGEPERDDSVARYLQHTDSIYTIALLERANDILVATGSGDDTGRLWKISPGSSSSSSSSTSSNTQFEVTDLALLTGHTDTIIDVAFSSDGACVATGGMDGRIGVWNIDSTTGNATLQTLIEDGPSEEIEWIQWHPKGPAILCGSGDGIGWLYSARSGKCMNMFAGHSGAVTAGCFTSDGKLVLTGSEDGTVRVWNPSNRDHPSIHEFGNNDRFSQGPVLHVVPKPDDPNVFMSTSMDGYVCLGHCGTGKVLRKFAGHLAGVDLPEDERSIETGDFSSVNTNIVATAGMDKRILIWDINTGAVRQTCRHDDGVVKVMFDKQSPLLYSCSVDRSIRVWDYRSGECVRTYLGHRDTVLDFAVAKQGSIIVGAGDDGASLVFTPSYTGN